MKTEKHGNFSRYFIPTIDEVKNIFVIQRKIRGVID